MKEKTILSHDGIPLKVAVSNVSKEKPWLALIIPFALKLKISKPFFDFFSVQYNIVAWESRLFLESQDRKIEKDAFSMKNHVKDVITVMNECRADVATLIGYCSGAGIALAAANEAPQYFSNLILVHGEYTLLDEPACTTQFSTDMDSLLSMASKDEKHLSLVFEKIKSERFMGNQQIPEGIDLPFSELHYLRRYANNYLSYKATDFKKLASTISHRTMLLTGGRDVQANVNSTERIKQLIQNSEIHIDPNADHYGIIRDDSSTLIKIWNYLCEQQSHAA